MEDESMQQFNEIIVGTIDRYVRGAQELVDSLEESAYFVLSLPDGREVVAEASTVFDMESRLKEAGITFDEENSIIGDYSIGLLERLAEDYIEDSKIKLRTRPIDSTPNSTIDIVKERIVQNVIQEVKRVFKPKPISGYEVQNRASLEQAIETYTPDPAA